jgi:hypothetical protein
VQPRGYLTTKLAHLFDLLPNILDVEDCAPEA